MEQEDPVWKEVVEGNENENESENENGIVTLILNSSLNEIEKNDVDESDEMSESEN